MTIHAKFILLTLVPVLLATEARAIISGTDAAAGEFPWIAGIVRRDVVPGPGIIGGGALVGDQWVVTAAHGVNGLSASTLEVWLGASDLGDATARRVFGVLAVFVHPDFAANGGTSVNDLALLLLDRRVTGIPVLPLIDDPLDLAVGDAMRVAGWGTTTAGISQPTAVLQEAPAEILSLAAAEGVFGPVIEEIHLPAVDPAGIATPCVGDSGSPLVKEIAGSDRLAGLVSFGTVDCSDASFPTIYTRIPPLVPWIQTHLGLTAEAPGLKLSGKGRNLVPGGAARIGNGSDFGTLGRRFSGRTRTFRLANEGPGLLTVRAATLRGRGFSLRRTPATIVPAGAATFLRVRFTHPGKRGRLGGRLSLQTNHPSGLPSTFRLVGRSR